MRNSCYQPEDGVSAFLINSFDDSFDTRRLLLLSLNHEGQTIKGKLSVIGCAVSRTIISTYITSERGDVGRDIVASDISSFSASSGPATERKKKKLFGVESELSADAEATVVMLTSGKRLVVHQQLVGQHQLVLVITRAQRIGHLLRVHLQLLAHSVDNLLVKATQRLLFTRRK